MLHRMLIVAASVLAMTAISLSVDGSAFAVERVKFGQAVLADAQKAGKSVLVHITAPWCPTCKAQKPVVDEILAKPEFKDTLLLDLDFDSGLQDVKALNARSQSTLIAYKGETETGRLVGVTKAADIEALIKSAN